MKSRRLNYGQYQSYTIVLFITSILCIVSSIFVLYAFSSLQTCAIYDFSSKEFHISGNSHYDNQALECTTQFLDFYPISHSKNSTTPSSFAAMASLGANTRKAVPPPGNNGDGYGGNLDSGNYLVMKEQESINYCACVNSHNTCYFFDDQDNCSYLIPSMPILSFSTFMLAILHFAVIASLVFLIFRVANDTTFQQQDSGGHSTTSADYRLNLARARSRSRKSNRSTCGVDCSRITSNNNVVIPLSAPSQNSNQGGLIAGSDVSEQEQVENGSIRSRAPQGQYRSVSTFAPSSEPPNEIPLASFARLSPVLLPDAFPKAKVVAIRRFDHPISPRVNDIDQSRRPQSRPQSLIESDPEFVEDENSTRRVSSQRRVIVDYDNDSLSNSDNDQNRSSSSNHSVVIGVDDE